MANYYVYRGAKKIGDSQSRIIACGMAKEQAWQEHGVEHAVEREDGQLESTYEVKDGKMEAWIR